MTSINRAGATSPPPSASTRELARLQHVARQLEAVFVQQLFKAMRETVPHDGILGQDSGEAIFTSMMDETIADTVPSQWHHGIGESLVRQLQGAIAAQDATAVGTPSAPGPPERP